jgi:hypothetical protein
VEDKKPTQGQPLRSSPWDLNVGPPPEKWDDWVEIDS